MNNLDINNKTGGHATDEEVEVVARDDNVVKETRREKRKRERQGGWEETRKRLATYLNRVDQTTLWGEESEIMNNKEVADMSRMSKEKKEALHDMAVDDLRRRVETFLANFPQGEDFTMVIDTPPARPSS